MNNIDDILYSPIGKNTSIISNIGNGSIKVDTQKVFVTIGINLLLDDYISITNKIIDHACNTNPTFIDARTNTIPKSLNLLDIVDRYYHGHSSFWVTAKGSMQPVKFTFTGEYGYFKFHLMPHHMKSNEWWYWLDITTGQLAAIDYGLVCTPPGRSIYRCFVSEKDALDYFN